MRASRGFTLAELLVSIGVVAILALMTTVGIGLAIESGRSTECLANLRQWGVALGAYLPDHEGRIPRRGQGVRPVTQIDRPDDWFNCLPPYLGLPSYSQLVKRGRAPRERERSIFVCPSAKDKRQPHFLAYGMNMYLSPWIRPDMHRLAEIPSPSQLAFLADGPGGWSSTVPSSQDFSVLARHRGFANVLFLDGRIQAFPSNYLGCQRGNETKPDVRWETLTGGINQAHLP